MSELLILDQLGKTFNGHTKLAQQVLTDISFNVKAGEFIALVGPSGSGKSTLLNILGLLDTASTGQLKLLGQNTEHLSDVQLTQLRNQHLGFVFQFHHLLNAFTAMENVLMPYMLGQGRPNKEQKDYAAHLLEHVGLAAVMQRPANQLSGGQQQRVAIARALMNKPKLLLADEPTGNLDSRNAQAIFELFAQLNQQQKCAVILVTHDLSLSKMTQRTLAILDGKLEYDGCAAQFSGF